MKNGKNFFFLLTFFLLFLWYPFEVTAVMASAQPDMENAAGAESGARPDAGTEAESNAESETETMPGTGSELPGEAPAETEPPAEQVPEPESVSTGAELMGWMESHKYTGGSVTLTDNIVLDESYIFVLAGSAPTERVLVETAGHTITVAGTVEFWSNAHLTFRGEADEYGILHVTEGGMLSLNGVSIENGQYGEEQPSETAAQYALWQEEGAGLIVSDCQVSGSIHYADTPFVMYRNSTYALVEREQTAAAVLPSEIKCTVNYQGQVNHNRPVQVTWDLTGTEAAQEKRLRFQIQGSFFHAASEVPPVCAVIYNDHPLTFTEVEARLNNDVYVFQGGYTKPEEFRQLQLFSEYSFDGVNWVVCEESNTTDVSGAFLMNIQSEVWDIAEHPYLYIRLRGEYDGIPYFSNVLRYAADNLETVEDCGGDRGGEISTAVLSEMPSGGEGTDAETEQGNSTDKGAKTETKPGNSTDKGAKTETKPGNSTDKGAKTETKPGNSMDGETKSESGADTEAATEPKNDADKGADGETESERSTGSGTGEKIVDETVTAANKAEAVASSSISIAETITSSAANAAGSAAAISQNTVTRTQELSQQNARRSRTIVIVSGFVMLSAMAGAIGFCVHAGLFRRMLYVMSRLFK